MNMTCTINFRQTVFKTEMLRIPEKSLYKNDRTHIFIYSKIRDMMISITISGFTKRLFFSEISVMFGQYSRGLLVPFRELKK